MKQLTRLFALSLLFLCFSCDKSPDPSTTDNLFKFKEYLQYHTYGNVSIADPVEIVLSKPLEQFEITQEIDANFLKVSPKTEGTLLVENQRKLIFQPHELLQPDTEYTFTLALGKLFPDALKEFKEYTFSFKTITPNFKLDVGNLQSYSKEWQYLTGTVQLSDMAPFDKAKELVSAYQDGKQLSVQWPEEEGLAKYFHFTIDSIQRKIDDDNIEIKWNGKSIGSDFKGSEEFAIPGQNNFTIVDAKATASPNARLTLNFSDPLKENQDFAGLVSIQNAESLRFEVEGNVLYVYPSNRIVGIVDVNVFTGIKNTSDFGLKKEFSERISFEQLKPSVKLLSQGVILPNATSTPLYFEAVNLSAVDVRIIKIFEDNVLQYLQTSNLNDNSLYELRRVGRRIAKKTIVLKNHEMNSDGTWKSYGINLSEYFNADPGAIYRVEISFSKDYAIYDCAVSEADTDTEEEEYEEYYDESYDEDLEDEEREEQYWDNEIYNYRRYSYNWSERDNPCHAAYYNADRVVSTNILGSDLGFIVKKGANKSYHFATTNLITAQPETDVKIKLYNFQQQLIGNATTDGQGLSIIDSEKNAAFAVAQKGNHFAYAKLNDGNALSMSNFDVSGKKLQKGLKGFLYTERGVHRPGDTIHLTFVLNDNGNPLPKDHPVSLNVTDARGKLVQRSVLNEGVEGFYYFPIPTKSTDPTGGWNATVSVGGAKFSKYLKVATIKPNRLKLKLDFEDEILDATKPVKGTAKVTWLHGAPARNLKIEMEATLRSTGTAFKDYPKYQFNDPIRSFNELETQVLKTTLNEDGVIDFNKQLDISGKAPGMLQATFLTKVFEGGGDFSIDVFSKNLAPYSHFVGLKSPEPHRYGSYFTDETTTFDVATVDTQGKASGSRKLEVKIFKMEWRWWWNRGYDNLSRYENATVHRPVKSFTVTSNGSGKTSFDLNIPENEGGRYLIRVIDPVSGHATGRIAYFYRNWWKRPIGNDSESAKMLLFSADKEQYQVGDDAQISFPSGSNGRALISIENGTEVLSRKWVTTQKGETTVPIELTKEMTPNVYVNISLLQPHAQTKNDLPIRLYGVVPILVEDPATILKPELKMPTVIQPETNYTVQVSENNNKAMTYTLAVVDEGLLDLTRFPTPKIHDAFYTREALGVKTFDIFDDVIGAYSGSIENIFAIGGGDAGAGAKNRKADRFKPVVSYLGPFELKAGETKSHNLTMPNYVGSVRTMVIAGDNKKGAYGASEATTPVRKPLMVLASLPRKLSPGEKVTLPVTVFAMEEKVKTARIQVKVGDALKPLGSSTQTISFDGPGEQIVNFEFEVLPADSFQTIEVLANGNGEKASYQVEVDVENPNPISQRTILYTLSENDSQTFEFSTYGVPGTNGATLEFSTLPPMDFNRRMKYLIRYPHGCIEQTTSSVFPQLYLDDIFDITYMQKQEMQKNVEAAIQKIGNFQRSDGSLSYWPGENSASDWGTSYAGHFMLEAKRKGYALPITFLDHWLRYQKTAARQWRNSQTSYNTSHAQAYRLYTLALAGQPELAAMNRLRESSNLSNEAKWRLAAAYALAGKENVASDIAKTANINFQASPYNYYTYGSPFRNKSMALETMVILKDPRQRQMAVSVAKELSSQRWLSTQETAVALMAMSKMVEQNGGKSMEVSYTHQGNTTTVKTSKTLAARELGVQMGNQSVTLSNKKANTVYVTLIQQGKLPLGEELSEQKNLSLKTQFLDGDGNNLDVSNLRQGTEITAKISVMNTSNDKIDNIALTQIFPSGWEIVNTSFTELGGGASGNARYTDIRDDRVNFYFDLHAKKSRTFTVKLNASYLGTYYLPGAQTEAMYDANYYARTKGQWILVEQ